MSRYIDAAELFDKVYEDVSAYYEEGKEVKDEILQIIADFRTADVQEVKHGTWDMIVGFEFADDEYKCSLCHCLSQRTTYCPNCGAKMYLEEES